MIANETTIIDKGVNKTCQRKDFNDEQNWYRIL